jgi:hypothetical protein
MRESARLTFRNETLQVNGAIVPIERSDGNDIWRNLYAAAGLNYPKYFKMDRLCRLSVASTELLLEKGRTKDLLNDRCAILLSNSASSLDTDMAYLHGLEASGIGSPAQFVYTLPNVMIGELCIRHRIFSHTEMYVMDVPDFDMLSAQAASLVSVGVCDAALIGWVDVLGDRMEAELRFLTL